LVAVVMVAGLSIRAEDDRMKAIEARLAALEKENAALKASKQEIKMDAAVQKAIDNAVARTGTGAKYGSAFLAPDQPDIQGIGLVFTGEYMYTKVQKGGESTFAYRNAPNSASTISASGSQLGNAINTENDWGHGFRLGVGYRLPYDGWDINATYSRLDVDGSKSARADFTNGTNFLWAPFFATAADIAEGAESFTYNKVDLEIGRNSKLTNRVSVRLFGGPSVVWFDQEDRFQYWANTIGTIFPVFDGTNLGGYYKHTTDATLYGLRAGANGDFKLGHGVSLVGKAAASLLTGELKNNTFSAIDFAGVGAGTFSATEIFQDTESKAFHIVPAFELEAGVAYDHKINENFNLKISLGYQFTNYFNLLEATNSTGFITPVPIGTESTIVRQRQDLGMHGLVFRVKLDF
jgi:hypothetical protein